MKTALLAQNEALEARTLNPNVKKSMLPLSHSVTFPVDVDGAIYPICCVEVVPSDSYKISNEVLLRQLQPLLVPQMTKYTLNTAYFYCSNRLGWKKWAMFADQANKGRANVNYSFELPRVCNFIFSSGSETKYSLVNVSGSSSSIKNVNYKNSIHTYFDVSMNRDYSTLPSFSDMTDDSQELPLAFPFFDYQIICRDYYTNIDRIPDNPAALSADFFDFNNPFSDWAFSNLYPVDDDEIRLVDGVNYMSGFKSGDDAGTQRKGFVLDKMRYHDLRYYYFTSSKRAPMRGEAPTVDTTMAVSKVDASDVVDILSTSTTTNTIGVNSDGTKLVAGTAKTFQNTGDPNTYTEIEAAPIISESLKDNLEKLKINLQVSKSINCAELMLMTQLTLWQTLNMLHKPYYNDFLNAHFDGVKVGDSLAEKPYYIGGTSQTIDINEVLQTSASTDSSKLGTQAAVAHSLAASSVGSFFAQDFGFVIGVAYILPDLIYDPAMPRWASRRSIEDYYFH